MELYACFKSLLDQETGPVVICDMDHRIIYMNPVACRRYEKYDGGALLGKSLLDCHDHKAKEMIYRVLSWFEADPSHNRVHTYYNEKENKDVYMIALRDEQKRLIGYYEKHEYRHRDLTPLYCMD